MTILKTAARETISSSVRWNCLILDCLQSAFSLKISLVLMSSSAIANHDVIITIRDYALVSSGFAARVLRFCVQ